MELLDFYYMGINFAYCLQILFFTRKGVTVPIYGKGGLLSAFVVIRSLLEKNRISNRAQRGIKKEIEYLKDNYTEEKSFLTLIDAEKIDGKVISWKELVMDELEKIVVFRAVADGILNSNRLCEGAKIFFQNKIWRKLPKIIKDDLEESTKCLITESWTASGLMSMRALESGVKKYYTKITGISADGKTFGAMLGELRNNSNADSKLIGYLDFLKDIRNDLAHPNNRIKQSDAEQVFQHTIQVLSIFFV